MTSSNDSIAEKLKQVQAELEQSKQDLERSEQLVDLLFNQTLDVILIVDGDSGLILHANQMAKYILGYKREALVGQPFAMLFPPTDDASEDDFLAHGLAIGGQDFLRADGTICPMDVTVKMTPWQNEDVAILLTLRDVTERREAEIAQQKLIEELDAFARTVAHDLKTPLTGIVGTASFLQSFNDALSTEKRLEMVNLIVQSGEKMTNIIEELLLLAQMRDKKIDVYPLDMGQIVSETKQRLNHMFNEHNATIVVPDHWPKALGYAPWIEEVWANYISNALKYGGRPPYIEVGADPTDNGSVRFWVRDNGPGLSPEEQAKLFTEFTQLSKVRADGHGLGLSIVQRIVERLDGTVGVESAVGVGSKFSFTLPMA
ncbi:MAG: PAS domain-containing sensor histidine kinase [Anaerolineae bacterium]|nr:PAS domain-containing sensor histidine kinase [Anaerolineae bacterium]